MTPLPLVSAHVWVRPAAIDVFAGLTAGGGDAGGRVVTGAGLGDDAQAATKSPATIVVATGNREKSIHVLRTVCSGETLSNP